MAAIGRVNSALALTVGVFLWAAVAQAAGALEQPGRWQEYRTENFTLIADGDPAVAIDMLQSFEAIRHLVLGMLRLSPRPDTQPVSAIYFSRSADYERFRPGADVAGYIQPSDEGMYLVVGPGSRDLGARSILLHEYVHYLVRDRYTTPLPHWYDEGFAEFIAASSIEDGDVRLGEAAPLRLAWVRRKGLLPMRKLIDPPEPDQRGSDFEGRFYATAWALVHFINFGPHLGFDDYQGQTRKYLQLYGQGMPSEQAFAQAYEISAGGLGRQLRRYMKKGVYGNRVPIDWGLAQVATRAVGYEEVQYRLGRLALVRRDAQTAGDMFAGALKANPGQGRSLSSLALLAARDGDYAASASFQGKALAVGPEDPVVLTDVAFARLEEQLALMQDAAGAVDSGVMDWIAEAAATAGAMEKRSATPHLILASKARLVDGDRITSIRHLLAAYRIMPWNISVNMALGAELAGTRSPQKAMPFLYRVVGWSHGRGASQKALDLIRDIESAAAATADSGKPVTPVAQSG